MKGHWADRLAGIEKDIAAMEQVYLKAGGDNKGTAYRESASAGAAPGCAAAPKRPACRHSSPGSFQRGSELKLRVTLLTAEPGVQVSVLYRHLNQAEAYEKLNMQAQEGGFAAVVPGSYTDSPYPLVYFFELRDSAGEAWQVPGLNDDLSNQPYYVLRQQ
jgi:hypothetical protein